MTLATLCTSDGELRDPNKYVAFARRAVSSAGRRSSVTKVKTILPHGTSPLSPNRSPSHRSLYGYMGTRELDYGQTFSKPRNCSQSRGGLKTRGLVRFKNLQANITSESQSQFRSLCREKRSSPARPCLQHSPLVPCRCACPTLLCVAPERTSHYRRPLSCAMYGYFACLHLAVRRLHPGHPRSWWLDTRT